MRIICVGKLKEKFWVDACGEYLKRLGRYAKVSVDELGDKPIPKNPSAADEANVLSAEGDTILSRIKKDDYVIALAIEGESLNSEGFAGMLSGSDAARLTFVIGGSLGLSPAVKQRANALISFSKMTFPHQLARVMLLEQIYRGYKILAGETYHK